MKDRTYLHFEDSDGGFMWAEHDNDLEMALIKIEDDAEDTPVHAIALNREQLKVLYDWIRREFLK